MILDLDVGNSRVKWRLRQQPSLGGIWPAAVLLEGEAWTLGLPAVERICLSSVLSAPTNQIIASNLARHFGVEPEFARATPEAAGVRSAYLKPETLGVDRWLAMVAAHRQYAGNLLVLDAGTAITLDVLSAGGQHIGGYILPGLQQLVAGLSAATSGVKVDKAQIPVTLQPGSTTQACVAAALAAAVRGLVIAAGEFLPQGASLILTGGDCAWVAEMCQGLPYFIVQVPDLVLDGLALSLP